MEGLWIILGLVVLGWIFLGPFFVFALSSRLSRLERRMEKWEGREPAEAKEESPGPAKEAAFERAKARVREEEKKIREDPLAQKPPPLPVAEAAGGKEPEPGPARTPSPTALPPEPQRRDVFERWLEKVGLKPPPAGAEGANVMAWWSTRIGLVLGVIAAVFFGLYVNQNTVPWVRLTELVATSLAVFGGGWWMEKKLGAFGRALSAGGLALLYVAAYAAYGLPAMKVIDSPQVGAAVQITAVAGMAGWALWRKNEGIFGLALALGYVTSWFTLQEGAEPLPLLSLLVLVVAGASLFASRGWWSGFWVGLAGSGGGLAVLTVVKWVPGGGPGALIALGSALFYTAVLAAALFVRTRNGDEGTRRLLPLVTSVGLAVGVIIVGLLEIEWEYYYAGFAVLFLVAGLAWKGLGEGEGMWEVMWAKTSVLVALYLIARFDGPVRAFALLAQAGTLLWLGHRRGWLVFEFGGLVAALVGWLYLADEWTSTRLATWGRDEIEGLAYLLVSFCLTAWFSRGSRYPRERRIIATVLTILVALGVLWVGVWRVDHEWAFLMGLAGATVLWRIAVLAEMKGKAIPLMVGTLGTLLWLAERAGSDHPVGRHSLVWLGLAWAYCAWFGRCSGLVERCFSVVLMLASVAAVWMAGDDLIGREWMPVIMLGLAVLWQAGDGKLVVNDLRRLSAMPVAVGAILALDRWDAVLPNDVLAGLLLAAGLYWVHGWWLDRGKEKIAEWRAHSWCRGLVLGVVLLLALQMHLEGAMLILALVAVSVGMMFLWRKLSEEPLSWLGLAAMVFAGVIVLDNGRVRDHWHEATVAAVFLGSVCNGLVLARAGRKEVLGNARVASVLWGSGAMASVLFGLVLTGEAAGWTTASWAVGAVALLAAGFWGGLRGYRVVALLGLLCAIVRLFAVDVQDTLWRIVAFGVTSGLLIGIGYVYNRYHQRLSAGDLDWRRKEKSSANDVPQSEQAS